jgi:hypothetical protein
VGDDYAFDLGAAKVDSPKGPHCGNRTGA